MMFYMRTTLRIEDSLLRELKALARQEKIPLTRVVDTVLRSGLQARRKPPSNIVSYQEKTFEMGKPHFQLDKALSISAAMEDEEILRKIELRK